MKFRELIPLLPNQPSWVLCWRWTRTTGVLGYGGRCSWVAVALVAIAAFLASFALVLSSLSLHPSQLVLQQTFLWNVYCTWWSMRRTNPLMQLWCLETRVLHWKSALLSVSSAVPKREGKEHHMGCFRLLVLNCFGGSHITSADVCLGWMGWLVFRA